MRYIIYTLLLAPSLFASTFGDERISAIKSYGQEKTDKLGEMFTLLQGEYFATAFFYVTFGMIAVFLAHYLIVGPKSFSHDGKKIFAFSVLARFIHWVAAVGFILLIPTGLVMVFGSYFGGGTFVRLCRLFHEIGTLFFALSLLPMFFMWVLHMFPTTDDIKWMMIVGGYLSKKKVPVPAGKYNAGQKIWFWIATFGGFVMVVTGALMYFNNVNMGFIASSVDMKQINLLRISAIVHNVLGMAVVAMFFTHVYMAVFAIKGSLHSMISGYKEEEEVKILHSSWYKELQKKA